MLKDYKDSLEINEQCDDYYTLVIKVKLIAVGSKEYEKLNYIFPFIEANDYNRNKAALEIKGDYSLKAYIMALARKSDTYNFGLLAERFPEIILELQKRYDAPGGGVLETDPIDEVEDFQRVKIQELQKEAEEKKARKELKEDQLEIRIDANDVVNERSTVKKVTPTSVKERNTLDLLELVCQLHSRTLASASKCLHDAYLEARKEMEKRIKGSESKDRKLIQEIIDKIKKEITEKLEDFLKNNKIEI